MDQHQSQTERHAISTTQTVLESIRYLHNIKQRPIGTSEIQTISELTADTVADCLKRLLERGHIYRNARGLYEPMARHPEPRPISQTWLPTGAVKIEIGDEVIALTPLEHRTLVKMLGGVMAEAAQMAAESAALQQVAVQKEQLAKIGESVKTQKGQISRISAKARAQKEQLAKVGKKAAILEARARGDAAQLKMLEA